MKKFLDFLKTPLGVGAIFLTIGLLIWGGFALFKAGQKSQLNAKLADVNSRLQGISARTNSSEHLNLLARKQYLEDLINNL